MRKFIIGLALLTFAAAAGRVLHFTEFYGSVSLMPQSSDAWPMTLILLSVLLGVLLLTEHRKGWVLLALAFLALCHNLRYPLVSLGYEIYLPWLYILAAGLSARAVAPQTVWSYALFLGFTYWMAGLSKLFDVTWSSGVAVEQILASPTWAQPWAQGLARLPLLPRLVTHVLPWLECLLPAAIAVAVLRPAWRRPLAMCAIAFHALLALCLNVFDISAAAAVAWFPFFENDLQPSAKPALWQKIIWSGALCALVAMYVSLLSAKVSGQPPLWAAQLARTTGLRAGFSHFSSSRAARKEVKIWGMNGGRREQLSLGQSRHWTKLLAALASRQASFVDLAQMHDYLCRHYGPGTAHGFSGFIWTTGSRQEAEGAPPLRQHSCLTPGGQVD